MDRINAKNTELERDKADLKRDNNTLFKDNEKCEAEKIRIEKFKQVLEHENDKLQTALQSTVEESDRKLIDEKRKCDVDMEKKDNKIQLCENELDNANDILTDKQSRIDDIRGEINLLQNSYAQLEAVNREFQTKLEAQEYDIITTVFNILYQKVTEEKVSLNTVEEIANELVELK